MLVSLKLQCLNFPVEHLHLIFQYQNRFVLIFRIRAALLEHIAIENSTRGVGCLNEVALRGKTLATLHTSDPGLNPSDALSNDIQSGQSLPYEEAADP